MSILTNSILETFTLSSKEKWLLVIVGAAPYVHGNTRLQKYALLVGKQILSEQDFFNDWRSDNYGGFSPGVAACMSKLVKENFIEAQEFTYDKDKKSNRYSLSSKGKNIVDDFLKTHSTIFDRITEMIGYYHPKKLMELLDNVYVLYPNLTEKSKIKAQVNKSIMESDSYLSTEYEIPADGQETFVPASPPAAEHVYNDDYFRQKLAKSIGLENAPKLDVKAFERLTGIISSKIKTKDFDSVELVKAVRGC